MPRSLPQSGARERFFIQGQAPGLTHKHYNRLIRLVRDKHSSLLQIFVNYGRKKFYNIGPRFILNLKRVYGMAKNALSQWVFTNAKYIFCPIKPTSSARSLSQCKRDLSGKFFNEKSLKISRIAKFVLFNHLTSTTFFAWL